MDQTYQYPTCTNKIDQNQKSRHKILQYFSEICTI